MISPVTHFIILIFLIGFELGTIPFLPMSVRVVSPVIVFLTTTAMQPGNRRIWASAVIAGLLFDAESAFPFGTYTLAYIALTGLIIYITHRFLAHHSLWSQLIAIVIASMFMGSVLALVRAVSWYTLHDALYQITAVSVLRYIVISIISNSVLFVMVILIKLLRHRKNPFQKWNGGRRFNAV